MTREDFIKQKITEQGYNVKSFAVKIDMPYSTLLSMLKGSIGGAAIDNVIKICDGLGITVDQLQNICSASTNLTLSEKEVRIIRAYRTRQDMQKSVDKLLGIDEDVYITKIAARNGDSGVVSLSSDQINEIVNSPDVDEDI